MAAACPSDSFARATCTRTWQRALGMCMAQYVVGYQLANTPEEHGGLDCSNSEHAGAEGDSTYQPAMYVVGQPRLINQPCT
mgnify:CR=1 FL=1